jgi:hypothetical protein
MTVPPTAARMIRGIRHLVFGLLLAAVALSAPKRAAADPLPPRPLPVAEPPASRVGRLAVILGKVELRPAGTTGWSGAEANDPVSAGSAIRSGAQARAIIEIGTDAVALADGSEVAIAALGAQSMAIDLAQGRVGLALRRRRAADVEVDLPQGEAWLQEPGDYEIDAGSNDGRPRFTVFAGGARTYSGGAEVDLVPGKSIELSSAAPNSATIGPAEADTFAAWWRARAINAVSLTPPSFASPDMTGFAALDGAGHWVRTGAYGEVWLPDALPADWAPYRDGHWRWFAPWGWTWIDDQPWGFAPFHYGRWTLIGQSWAWVPGSLATYPIYMPAAVAFLGTPGIGVSYAGGNGPAIGWFPLAPGEAYWPSYTQDLDYIREVNRGDMVDLGSIRAPPDGRLPVEVVDWPFANRLSASVVPRPIFVGAQPVATVLLDLPLERLRNVPVVLGSPRIGPTAPSPPPMPPGVLTARASPPAPRSITAGAKRVAWVKTVHLAAIRSRFYLQAVRLRHFAMLYLREPAFAEPARLRRLVALRLVHRQTSHKNEAAR